jgi:hypothetical protein
MSVPNFEIRCMDSLKWLSEQPDGSLPNVLTGLPDLNELKSDDGVTPLTVEAYLDFFRQTVSLIGRKLSRQGYAIFIQTDRKHEGQLIDKSYHVTDVLRHLGLKMIWHKIVCQRDPEKSDLFRPTYSHILGYTYSGTPGSAFPDVYLPGPKLYENATPSNVALELAKFLANASSSSSLPVPFQVIDPFVGRGTLGLASLKAGLTFLGLDLDSSQCQLATQLLSQPFDALPPRPPRVPRTKNKPKVSTSTQSQLTTSTQSQLTTSTQSQLPLTKPSLIKLTLLRKSTS